MKTKCIICDSQLDEPSKKLCSSCNKKHKRIYTQVKFIERNIYAIFNSLLIGLGISIVAELIVKYLL